MQISIIHPNLHHYASGSQASSRHVVIGRLEFDLEKLQKRQHGMCWRKTKTVSPKLLIHGLESAQANDEYGFYSQRTHMEAQKN